MAESLFPQRTVAPRLLAKVDCFNTILRDTAKVKEIPIVDLANHICPTTECAVFSAGKSVRPDGLHPDGVGAEETARWTFGRISSVLAERRDGPVGAKSAERSLLER